MKNRVVFDIPFVAIFPKMDKHPALSQKDFDELLNWLAPDRDAAGESYNRIRDGLVRYFRIKGCYESQSLADETINRVARKLNTLDLSRGYSHATYFYGFAKNVFLEYLSRLKKGPLQFETDLERNKGYVDIRDEEKERQFECLEKCLKKLKKHDSSMIVAYFGENKSAKFEARRQLAEVQGITVGNLQTRVCRIKNVLRDCIWKCLDGT